LRIYEQRPFIGQVKEDKVKFVSLQFTDVTGAVKSVDIPVHRLESALDDGVWFDGSSVEGFARIQKAICACYRSEVLCCAPWSPVELRERDCSAIFTSRWAAFAGDRGYAAADVG